MNRNGLALLLVIALCASAMARDEQEAPRLASSPPALPTSQFGERSDTLFLYAADGPGAYGMPGTTERGYSFDGPNGEAQEAGWFGVDRLEQDGPWWHLASTGISSGHATDMSAALPFDFPSDPHNDFALWCGREFVDCGWENTPGYGNGWDQFVRISMPTSSRIDLYLSYSSDYEGTDWDYMQVFVEIDGSLHRVWREDTEGPSGFIERHLVHEIGSSTQEDILIQFCSDSAWSDEDGFYESDVGAVWIDNIIAIADGQEVFRDDFESGVLPQEISFEVGESAGDFAALHPGAEILQEDSNYYNESHSWAFFDSLYISQWGPFAGWPVIPTGPPYVYNAVESPLLEMDQYGNTLSLHAGSRVTLDFLVYRDLELELFVFFFWEVAVWLEGEDCARPFENDNHVWYGDFKTWDRWPLDITEYVEESAGGNLENVRAIVAQLGAVDGSYWWGEPMEYYHPSNPYFDDVSVSVVNYPTDAVGPHSRSLLKAAYPNPFNPSTKISYSLEYEGPAVLAAFDIRGRRVRDFVSGVQAAGPHEIEWDGCDDRGNRLASGVYFLRFKAGNVIEEEKLVLLK